MEMPDHTRKPGQNQRMRLLIVNDSSCPLGPPSSGSGRTEQRTHFFDSYRLPIARHTIPAEARSPGRGKPRMRGRESPNVQLLTALEPKKGPEAALRTWLWARSPPGALTPSPTWCVLSVTARFYRDLRDNLLAPNSHHHENKTLKSA